MYEREEMIGGESMAYVADIQTAWHKLRLETCCPASSQQETSTQWWGDVKPAPRDLLVKFRSIKGGFFKAKTLIFSSVGLFF